MIVCSCNVITAAQVLAAAEGLDAMRRHSPVQAYKCLGCAPQCGRCLATVRALLARAKFDDRNPGCRTCPGRDDARGDDFVQRAPRLEEPVALAIAAE